MESLPAWMTTRDQTSDLRPVGKPPGFARTALAAFARVIAGALADESTARRPGFLQGIDVRFKIIGLIGLTLAASMMHSLLSLGSVCLICAVMAGASRVDWKRMAGIWLVVPLFSAGIMLPACLNIVTPGNQVLTIWNDRHLQIAVTDAGLMNAARMVLRTAACVSLVTLLAVTTLRVRLFRGLRALGVPQVFVTVLAMMDRYLVLLIRSAEEVHLARMSRTIGSVGLRTERAWAAAGIGFVFRRAYLLAEEVHRAMISRGYSGEVRLLREPRWRAFDAAFAVACAGLSVLLVLAERMT